MRHAIAGLPMLLFWISSAVLTVGVIFALTRAVMRAPLDAASEGHPDLDVYRDQLKEIEADKERGLLSVPEAEAARVEVARRLLARAGEAEAAAGHASSKTVVPSREDRAKRDQRLFTVIAAAVPVLALALYLVQGAPGMPGQPAGQRLAQSQKANGDIEAMIAKVEQRLRENPGEGQGWDVIAPIYLRLERFTDAANAFQRALTLLGPSPRRLTGFAEATVLANNGVVVEAARKAYEKLLELEPGRPEARFGLALAKEQDGKLDEAEAGYRTLLAEAPAGADWREFVAARLDTVIERRTARKEGKPTAALPPPTQGPPSGPAAEAVAGLPPAERQAMIQQMVEGLEAKLKANGRDVDGWQRLMRSWTVLGRKDKAVAALGDARKALASDSQALLEINAFAKGLGLP